MSGAPYHHGNLREALVAAAVEVVREGGPEALSVRELARRVGVSHAAAYRHFADREGLVDAVAERAMAVMVDHVDARVATVVADDPVARARRRLVQIGVGYVDFALAETGLFRLLFTAFPDPPEGSDAKGADPYSRLNVALDELVAVGFLAEQDRVGADVICWASVHGFAVLCVEGPLRSLPADERDATLTTLLLGIDRGLGGRREWPSIAS